MPANITSSPPALHLANEPAWWQILSGVQSTAPGEIVITVGSASTDGDTFRIRNTGIYVTFWAKTTPDADNPFELPLYAAGAAAYADVIAEVFRSNEAFSAYFHITRNSVGGEHIVLTQRVLTPIDFFISNNLTGCTHTKTDVPAVWAEANLSCVLQVWRVGDTEDTLLALYHATYRHDDRATDIDVSAAFAELRAALPDPFTILYTPPNSGFFGEAPEAWMPYYVRYADKFGNPATTRALQRSDVQYTIHGSLAGDSLWQANVPVRHTYRDRLFQPYQKPILCSQPDWVYVWTGEIEPDTPFYLSALVTFDDGTTADVTVTPPNTTVLQPNRLYWFVSGYMQLGLDGVSIPSGATRIVAYTWRLYPADLANIPLLDATVRYRVEPENDYKNLILLFDNGVGGCETVALRGKTAVKYTVKAEEYARPRSHAWTQRDGDFGTFAAEGRKEWEASTGLYDRSDPYLEHLLQLPLADTWLVDTFGSRFLPVRVESREMTFYSDDDTLASITFTIRALWQDSNYNV